MLTLINLISIFIVGDTKAGVQHAEQQVIESADKSRAKVALAKAYWMDQNQEAAFKIFVDAIDSLPNSSLHAGLSDEEQDHYQEALTLYLNQRPDEAKTFGQKIRNKYLPLVKSHPDWYTLAFLVAIADANMSDFEHFFELFYESYKNRPSHFLALKTKAILHIKLFERSKTPGDQDKEREIILNLVRKAQTAFPGDYSLYRLEIAYASPTEKQSTKQQVLNKILSLSMIPSRADTLYFLSLALELDDVLLTQRWFKRAKEWYPGSRSIQQLEENGK